MIDNNDLCWLLTYYLPGRFSKKKKPPSSQQRFIALWNLCLTPLSTDIETTVVFCNWQVVNHPDFEIV